MPKRKAGADVFIIDVILDHRKSEDGRTEYLIRWEGYGDDENTWEPPENIYNKDLIKEYESKCASIRQSSNCDTAGNVDSELGQPPASSQPPSTPESGQVTSRVTPQHAPPQQMPDNESSGPQEVPVVDVAASTPGEPPAKKGTPADLRAEAFERAKKRMFEQAKDLKPQDLPAEAEEIAGATMQNGELTFLIKWKIERQPDLVPARIANIRFPQEVIRYYEQRLCWHSHDQPVDTQDLSPCGQRA